MEYQFHNDHTLVVCEQADGQFDFLVSFLQLMKTWICPILVDHGRIISVTVEQPVTTLSVRIRLRPMLLSWCLEFDIQIRSFVLAELIIATVQTPTRVLSTGGQGEASPPQTSQLPPPQKKVFLKKNLKLFQIKIFFMTSLRNQ